MRPIPSTLALIFLGTAAAIAQTTAPVEAPAGPERSAAAEAMAVPAGTYAFDPHHSHIVWSYDHLGWSTSTGVVRGVTGTITIDPADPGAATVEASFPMTALQTVSPDLDRQLMGEDFFRGIAPDSAVTFASTAVEPTGKDRARLTGDLTLNGMTRPVSLEVMLRQMGEHPATGLPGLAFQGTGTMKRSDFNLGAFAPAIGDEVQVTVNIEAQKE